MSIEDAYTVDAVGVDHDSGRVVLLLSDHLDWDERGEHLRALGEKLNVYLRFIESGELEKKYPRAAGRIRLVDVFMQHEPDQQGKEFLANVETTLKEAGIEFRARVASTDGD